MGQPASSRYAVSALASVALLIAVLQDDAQLLRFPPFSWLVYLGRISYGLYVFHLFALALMSQMLFVPLLGIRPNFELRLIALFSADSNTGSGILQVAGATVPEAKEAFYLRYCSLRGTRFAGA